MGWCCCTAATGKAGGVVWASAAPSTSRHAELQESARIANPPVYAQGSVFERGTWGLLQATTWPAAGCCCCYRARVTQHEHALCCVCQFDADGLKQGAKSAAAAAAFISRANTHTC